MRLHDARTPSPRKGPSGLCARSSRLPGRPAAGPPPCSRGAPFVGCKTPAGREPQPHSALSPKKQTADDSLQACRSGQAYSDRPFIPLEDQSRRHPVPRRLRSSHERAWAGVGSHEQFRGSQERGVSTVVPWMRTLQVSSSQRRRRPSRSALSASPAAGTQLRLNTLDAKFGFARPRTVLADVADTVFGLAFGLRTLGPTACASR